MSNPKKLVELAGRIQEEARKYHIINIAIAATDEETMDYPFQFIGDCENGDCSFLSSEDCIAFISFLKTTLSDVGISFNIRSELEEFLAYGMNFQYSLDTAIPLNELDPNRTFKEQFQKRKERADKERLHNADNEQGIKRKIAAKDEEIQKLSDVGAKATLPLSDSESEKALWKDKITSQKRPRLDLEVDENKVKEAMAKICSAFNENEVRSLQQKLNDFLSSKSKEQHSIG